MSIKKLPSKRNFLVALTMLGFFVMVGIVSLFSVFALPDSSIGSTVNVSYVTNDVSATVSANYWIYGDVSKTNFSGGDAGTQYLFADEDQNAVKRLSMPNNLTLTGSANKIIFEFIFENVSDDVALKISLVNSPINNVNTTNMIQKYYVSSSQIAVSGYGSIVWENNLLSQTISAGAGNKKYIYVEAYYNDIMKDANYEGGFNWKLENPALVA